MRHDAEIIFPSRVLYCGAHVPGTGGVSGSRLDEIYEELIGAGNDVLAAATVAEAAEVALNDATVHAILIDWHGFDGAQDDAGVIAMCREVKARDRRLPIFVLGDRSDQASISLDLVQTIDEIVWKLQDSPVFVARRIRAAIKQFVDDMLPPLTKAMMNYELETEYPWAAPGHQGGVAFTKSRVGNIFLENYGEDMFRNDMGIERGNLGSLLDHTGPIGESEKFISRVFDSDRTYTVLNGTSGSNRTIMQIAVGDGEIAICDRNCHKSIAQGLALTGGIPIYLQAKRNRYGIIGLIPPQQMTPEAIAARIAANPLAKKAKGKPVYAVVTNCTYDGMCYDSKSAEDLLAKSSDRLHMDEAWYGYAAFHPIYRNRYAMRHGDRHSDGPTVFATHSTHKLLAALSQTSMIHVRNGKSAISHAAFNESFAAQATTSPYYPMIASNEVAAAMMDRGHGKKLIGDVIAEAVACRQAMMQIEADLSAKGSWFFESWNARKVTCPKSGKTYDFADAPADLLCNEPSVWEIRPGEGWHGFDDLPAGWAMLDPTKFGVIAPGLNEDGTMRETGIPAEIVSAYIGQRGIVPSRTTAHIILFLFSMGVTKGKWGTLISTLLAFKEDYDRNTPVDHVLQGLVAANPGRYNGLGLRDFCDKMWADMREARILSAEAAAYELLPEPVMTPRAAFQGLIAGDHEEVPSDKLPGRIAGVAVIPYPPGIPIVMPGERFGDMASDTMKFIANLERWGRDYPGFERVLEGAEWRDGKYWITCLKQ